MKYLFNILRIIIIVILSIVLVINIFILTSRYIFKQYPPKVFKYFHATVISGSMEPTFYKGDLLIFKEYEDYDVNDIILFKEEESLITHRIIEIKDSKYITKGDANNTEDKLELTLNNIEGKLIKIMPNIGSICEFFRTPLGLLIIIVGVLLTIEIPDIFYNLKSRRDKNEL